MANTLDDLMPQILAQGLLTLRKRLVMPSLVNRDYGIDAKKKGSTVDVPLPPSISARDVVPGSVPVASPDMTPDSVAIQLSNWKEAPFHLTDKEQLEVIDDAVIMAVDAAANSLAEAVNASLFAKYKGIYGYAGTAGTTPFGSDYTVASAARKVLNNQKAPLADRRMVIDPDAEEKAINLSAFADASFTTQSGVILEGDIGRKLGYDWFMDQQVPTHTKGVAGTVLIDQADVAIGDTDVHLDGLTTKASVGDVFTVAGDTQTYVVVTASDLSTTDGDITFQPPAKVAWANDAAVTFKASHVVNLAFNRDAFALAVRPLGQPQAPGSKVMTMVDSVTGLPLRLEVSRQHKQDNWSFDILWGVELVRAELACRVAG